MIFKECTTCRTVWRCRDDFIDDRAVDLVGYQADFVHPDNGILLFNHLAEGCGTTVAVPAAEMLDLFEGPIHEISRYGSDECAGHCLVVRNLDRCRAPCRNARVREVMHVILERRRRAFVENPADQPVASTTKDLG